MLHNSPIGVKIEKGQEVGGEPATPPTSGTFMRGGGMANPLHAQPSELSFIN